MHGMNEESILNFSLETSGKVLTDLGINGKKALKWTLEK
jgi:hypothetical protein